MRQRVIHLIGDSQRREFQAAVAWLSRAGRCQFFSDVPIGKAHNAANQSGQLDCPDWIVLLAGRPGEFSQDAVRGLIRRWPTSRVIAVLGSWCEGEPRSGKPWPGVVRVLWHQWEPRLTREWEALTAGRCGTWSLPRTATRVEQLLLENPVRAARRGGWVTIDAAQREARESLMSACRTAGYTTQCRSDRNTNLPVSNEVAIWDAPGWRRDEWASLADCVAAVHPAPVLALVGAPRWQDVESAKAAGAAAVLGKPFLLPDLGWWIERFAAATRPLVGTGDRPVS